MRVRLLQGIAAQSRGSFSPGDLFDCTEEEAGRLVAAGIAEYRDARPSPPSGRERATRPAAERATAPRELTGQALRAKYEEVVGHKPGRRSEDTMRQQIAEAGE